VDWIPLNLGKENGMAVFLLNVWEDPMFLEDPLLLNLKEYPLLLKKQKMKVKNSKDTTKTDQRT
jgi:hypothetical protein